MRASIVVTCLAAFAASQVRAFGVESKVQANPRAVSTQVEASKNDDILPTRREFASQALAGAVAWTWGASAVHASGGATAGGAYLLSAKQRYNERVTKSIKSLLAAAAALENGSSAEAKAYFSGEDTGSWKDLTSAGYLLSNAFRRNSTAAPDSLPSVKKWKLFMAEVNDLQKVLKKKGAAGAADAFPKVEEALNVWLAEIDLPSAREL